MLLFLLTAVQALNNVPSTLLQAGRLVSFKADNGYYMQNFYHSGFWFMDCSGQKNTLPAQLIVSVVSPGVYAFQANNGLFLSLSYANGYWFFAPTHPTADIYAQFYISDSTDGTGTVFLNMVQIPELYVGRGYYGGYNFLMIGNPPASAGAFYSRLQFTLQPWSQFKSMQIQWGAPVLIPTDSNQPLIVYTDTYANHGQSTGSFQGIATDSSEVTSSWSWEQATSLGITMEVTMGIPDVASMKFGVSVSLTTTIGTGGSNSTASSYSYQYSEDVPPSTEAMAQTYSYQTQVNVPFVAIVTYINDNAVDQLPGIYSGVGDYEQYTVVTQFPFNCTEVPQGGSCSQSWPCCQLGYCCNQQNICGNLPSDCNPGAP